MTAIISLIDGPIARVKLNRPDVRNAFNDELIGDLSKQFKEINQDPKIRVVILSGEGSAFCAGGDLHWMKSMVGASRKDNEEDARRLAQLLSEVDQSPKPVIAKVHGAVIGGGVGLMSACDIVLASEGTVFALAEVKLGLIPAVISPFVIARIGGAQARRYFLTGERFDAQTALRLGLVHEAVSPADIETKTESLVRELLSSGPQAIGACKELIHKVSRGGPGVQDYTVKKLAELRVSLEAQEGMKAFLEKKKPSWNV